MSYYQGDYYQGDWLRKIGRKVGRYVRKKIAPELRKAAPLLAFVPGVGVVGAGAINALTRSKRPNQTTADTLMRVLQGPSALPETEPMRGPGAPRTRIAVPVSAAFAARPIRKRPIARRRAAPRRRVMSPYQRNRAARLRAAAARRSR